MTFFFKVRIKHFDLKDFSTSFWFFNQLKIESLTTVINRNLKLNSVYLNY